MGRRSALAATALTVGLLAACGGGGGGGEEPERIVLGIVPLADVQQLASDAGRLGTLLSVELGVPVEATVTDGDGALVGAMRTGQVDVALFGPIALMRSVEEAGTVPVLQTVRDGTATYHAEWITSDPARFCLTPVVEVEDPGSAAPDSCNGTATAPAGPVGEEAVARITEGDAVQFGDEGSPAGHLYPATQLRRVAGLDPVTGIEARFARNADAVTAVADGEVAVGIDGGGAEREGPRVTVFAWSPEIPHGGVAVRGDLPVEWQRRIVDAMTAVIATPAGADAFAAVYDIEGLVPADPVVLEVARQVADTIG